MSSGGFIKIGEPYSYCLFELEQNSIKSLEVWFVYICSSTFRSLQCTTKKKSIKISIANLLAKNAILNSKKNKEILKLYICEQNNDICTNMLKNN